MCQRTRFAPTPSGYLHLGNAFSFILTWLLAKQHGAKVLLRIDDLDSARKRPEYVEDVFRSLEWLGLTYDEGPTGPDEFESVYSQRHRLDLYRDGFRRLRQSKVLFPCACSRSEIKQSAQQQHQPSCRQEQRALGQKNVAWRVATSPPPQQWFDHDGIRREIDLHERMRDFVVWRRDGIPAYQLTSLFDDEYFGVDLIVRGEDLLASTAAQKLLSRFVPDSTFEGSSFVHHRILKDKTDRKLSKSHDATSLAVMRKASVSSASLYRRLSPYFGLSDSADSIAGVLERWLELP